MCAEEAVAALVVVLFGLRFELVLLLVSCSSLSILILEHVAFLGKKDVAGCLISVSLIKFVDLGESALTLVGEVHPLEELAHVIHNQEVLEQRDQVCGLVIDYVVYHLHVVEVTRRQVLPMESQLTLRLHTSLALTETAGMRGRAR